MAVKCILTGQTPSVLDGVTENVQSQIDSKVDKVTGKGLSTEDYTTAEKTKLSGIEEGAQKNTVISVNSKTDAVTLVKGDVGLGNVDNTSDVDKPISTATQTALDTKQPAITASGILQGDGAGNITAAEEAEVSLVALTIDMVDGAVGFTDEEQQTVAETVNADTLGGNAPEYYATKASVDTLTTTVNSNKTAVETVQSNIQAKLDKTGGTMVGKLTAQSNTDYTVAQVRNVFISTSDPTGGNNGDIWLKYEA